MPRAIPFRRPEDETGTFIDADAGLDPLDRSTVVIGPMPALHHLCDDVFGGAANSQFQRSSEGTLCRRGFLPTPEQARRERSTIRFPVEGVESPGTAFRFNEGTTVLIASSESNGDFSEFTCKGSVAETLRKGIDTIDIASGPNDATGDRDDIEFVDPIVTLR